MDIIIDLKNEKRSKVNVEMSWKISVAERKGNIWDRLPWVRNNQNIERRVYVDIQNIFVPKEIRYDKDCLFSIVSDQQEFKKKSFPVQINLIQKDTPFQLYFNQQAIIDCSESQQRVPKKYTISFDVVVLDESNNKIDSHKESINITFAPLDVKPRFAINLEKESIKYNSQLSELKIGEIVTWIDESYQYTPKLNIDTKIGIFDGASDMGDVLFFKEKGTRVQEWNGLLKPSRKELRRFEMYIDLSKISNPIEEEKCLTIENKSKFSVEYSPEIIQPLAELTEQLLIKRDGQSAELKVIIDDDVDDTLEYIDNGNNINVSEFSFTPQSKMQRQLTIDIANAATDGSVKQAGVIIRNFSISDSVCNDVKVLDDNGKIITIFTTIDGDDWEHLNSNGGLFLKNGKDSFTSLDLTFNPSQIAEVVGTDSECVFAVETVVSFDYYENKKGQSYSDSDFKYFSMTIHWKLQLEPYPEWLCVDYGSSAIVCKYDKKVIDLKKQKDFVFSNERNGYDKFTEDSFENGTKFLSSDILFHQLNPNQTDTSLCVEQANTEPYNTLAVCLSPTSSLVVSEVQRQLPCLKILVGNENLPTNAHYDQFSYLRNDENTGKTGLIRIKDAKVANEKNCLANVTNIFEEAYNELFKYFVSPVTGDKRKLNKLVLTYPNTYTPTHLGILRGIADKTFPYLRDGYLKFVSESDAVAAYYIANWSKFNKGGNIKEKETVLVYDMGAGTLDITVLDKCAANTRKIEVEVRGKIGTGKAGNYLDYTIACILQEIGLIPIQLVSTDFVANSAIRTDMLHLKYAIKTEIKPRLVPGEIITYSFGRKSLSVEADKIINHPKFQRYLEDVTTNIFKQIGMYIGGDFDITTVILSGRSCRLQVLRNAIEESTNKLSTKTVRVVEFDSEKDEEKTLVAEGAIAQVSKFDIPTSKVKIKSRRLYASYGLVYQELGGHLRYVELLNHNDIPYTSATGIFDGKNININGTSSSAYIRLVQTYMSPEETEANYNVGNTEFISDMEEFDMANFNNADELNVRLRLDRNNNVSLYVNGLKSIASTPKGVDLTSAITKQSIWPVTI
mgnify:FL=1